MLTIFDADKELVRIRLFNSREQMAPGCGGWNSSTYWDIYAHYGTISSEAGEWFFDRAVAVP